MNPRVVAAVIGQLGEVPRDFLGGWIEGRTRYMLAGDRNVIAASVFERGSTRYAASNAAVAFHQALDDEPRR